MVCFYKMYGLGNDFVVIDVCDVLVEMLVVCVCGIFDCYMGIGFD